MVLGGESAGYRQVLDEMKQRRLVGGDVQTWSPSDSTLLLRLRQAEALGAVELLRARFKTLKGLAVDPIPGLPLAKPRLTKEGFERYLFVKSQEAIRYFEEKGVDAKWIFRLKDMQGRRIFEPDGKLTSDGDALYTRALSGQSAFWRTPSGEIMGNRRQRPQ